MRDSTAMKKILTHTAYTILAILLLPISYSQHIEVAVDKDSILIGEPIKTTISFPIAGATSSLIFSEGDSIGNGFEVFEVMRLDTVGEQTTFEVLLSTFELGNQFIPPFSIFYGSKKVVSRPIPVFVSLVEVDTTQPMKDIKPIFTDPLTSRDYAQLGWNWLKQNGWWILLLLLALIVLFVIFWSKKEKNHTKVEQSVRVTAHEKAFAQLEELKSKQLWQKGMQKQYNVELTAIIEEYLTERYQVPTLQKTSGEIIHSLRFVEMGEENKRNLRKLLMLSDLVKFAKEKPTAQENEEVLRDAESFIETTKESKIS